MAFGARLPQQDEEGSVGSFNPQVAGSGPRCQHASSSVFSRLDSSNQQSHSHTHQSVPPPTLPGVNLVQHNLSQALPTVWQRFPSHSMGADLPWASSMPLSNPHVSVSTACFTSRLKPSTESSSSPTVNASSSPWATKILPGPYR
jgi:hypothetical protein